MTLDPEQPRFLYRAREDRVPHISLVFREMWDTTPLDAQLYRLSPGVEERLPRRYDVSMSPTPEVLDRARKIKLFLMDVDGTITDGSVNLISLPSEGGVAEMKAFNSQDGAGLKLAHIMGIRTGFITGRKSPAVTQRAHELKVEFIYLGQETKMAAFNECLQKAGVQAEETAYMGDDLPDMPVAQRAGLAVAVANAAPELKAICHFVTNAKGGEGSAREIVELILKAQERWEEAVPRALA